MQRNRQVLDTDVSNEKIRGFCVHQSRASSSFIYGCRFGAVSPFLAANKSNDNDNNSSSPSLVCSSPNGGIEALNSPPMTLGSAIRPAGHGDP